MDVSEMKKEGNQVKMEEIVEAILFASGEPVPIKKLSSVLEIRPGEMRLILESLQERYQNFGGLTLLETQEGVRLTTKKVHSEYIDRYFSGGRKKGLSNAALEVLAIVAMRQPVTKAEIEEMRGVSSDAIVQHLLKKELIYCSGKLDKIGNPSHYSTTDKFLEVFELKSLDELPTIDELMLV